MPLAGTCQGCGTRIQIALDGGVSRQVSSCPCTTRKGKPSELLARPLEETRGPITPGRNAILTGPWSAAKPTDCPRGHRHGSRIEARFCGIVLAEASAEERVFVHARVPLWVLGADAGGRPASYFTPDFLVLGPGPDGRPVIRRCFDAKGRTSREWRRGRAAFQETYGVEVVEVGSRTLRGRPR